MKLYAGTKKIIKRMISHSNFKLEKSNKDIHPKNITIIPEHNSYTVVSAVYNVEKYLEEYFRSMIIQSLDFENHINLIMVDDGSTDNSSEIIRQWQAKFPENITYIRKENGGQASARNLGLKHVETEWVTFIDPDDFLDYRYFEEVDKCLIKNGKIEISLISCNTLFYYEKNDEIKDTHALKYRFAEEEKIVSPSDMKGFIQLSASSAFFRKSLLNKLPIEFDEKIRPSFEDAHLVNRYFMENRNIDIAFLKNAKYLYRKRKDGSSTLDTSWRSTERYDNVLKNGYLDILQKAQSQLCKAPLYLQRTVLYDLVWHLKLFLNNSHKLGHLTNKQKKNYLTLIEKIFQFIEPDTIWEFELAGISLSDKVGLLGRFKKSKPPYFACHVDDYDKDKHELRLQYFCYYEPSELFMLDKKTVKTHIAKTRVHDFSGEVFLYERIVWLPLKQGSKFLDVKLGNMETRIVFAGIQYLHPYDIPTIINHFEGKNGIDESGLPAEYRFYRKIYKNKYYDKFNGAWLLMDRDMEADDNAEHLYRYIQNNYPDINLYFLLRKGSHDWDRLEEDGFNLMAFDTEEHAIALLRADHLISSQADHFTTHHLPEKWFWDIMRRKFTFLQHGVILHDLSNWLNSKEINCFITTSPKEYDSICGNYNHYKFTRKEVMLTGLPRHDALIDGKNKLGKMILIMPTWRQNIVGLMNGTGDNRSLNEQFAKTLYVKSWKALLHSKRLKKLVQFYDYTVIFAPHTNIQPYLDTFNLPEHITSYSRDMYSIQTLFQKASIMITDYSSVAFEMGILRRGCIYYQFDYDEVFGGGHTTKEGYFSYQDDGFGPVCHKKEDILNALEVFLKAGGKIDQKYKKRMEDFFAFSDTNNCQRVFEAIHKMEAK